MISIIIPVYNAEKTIERCLDSIINQTFSDFEVLIINDGSTDNTLKILRKYKNKDARIKIFEQINSGVSAARNLGMENALGEYIMFVDSDDWLETNMLEVMYKCIKDKDVDVVRCNYFNDYFDKQVIAQLYELSDRIYFKKNEDDYTNMRKHFLFSNQSIKNLVMLLLIKKDCLKNVRFNINLYMMEDVLFYEELFSTINSIYFLDIPLYHYTDNPESVTHSKLKYKKMIYGILDSNVYLINYLKENTLMINFLKDINHKHFQIIIYYLMVYCIEFKKEMFCEFVNDLFCNEKFIVFLKSINLETCNIKTRIYWYIIRLKISGLLYIILKINKRLIDVRKGREKR